MKQIGNAFGALVGLAIVAVIVAKPGFISPTFTGVSNVIGTAARGGQKA